MIFAMLTIFVVQGTNRILHKFEILMIFPGSSGIMARTFSIVLISSCDKLLYNTLSCCNH